MARHRTSAYFVRMTTNFVETDAQTNNDTLHRENKDLVEALANSTIYQDYERAFSETTGLPVSMRPVESWQLAAPRQATGKPVLRNDGRKKPLLRRLSSSATTAFGDCPARTANPYLRTGIVRHRRARADGERLVGFLQTGQVFRKKPTEAQFNRTASSSRRMGRADRNRPAQRRLISTPVLSSRQHESVVKLLAIFAQHLSMVSNQIVVREQTPNCPSITRAKQFIPEHQTEELSLGQVAKAVNTSKFYFCKMFKKATGINFTDYSLACARKGRKICCSIQICG